MAANTKRLFENALFFVLFSGIVIFYVQLLTGLWLITPDSADYLEGARSIAQGKGYVDAQGRFLSFFPPGTSLIYSLAAFFPRDDYYLFNALTLAFALGFFFVSYFFIKQRYGFLLALVSLFFLTFSVIVINQSVFVLSDFLFSFFFMLTVYLFPAEKLEGLKIQQVLGLGILTVVCYYIRTAGLFIFCCYFFYLLFFTNKHRVRTLSIYSLIFLASFFLLRIRNSKAETPFSYFDLLFLKKAWFADSGTAGISDLAERTGNNLIRIFGDFNFLFSNQSAVNISGILLVGLMTAGVILNLRDKRLRLYLLFAAFHFMQLSIAIEDFSIRHMIPLIPVSLIFVFEGLNRLFILIRIPPKNISLAVIFTVTLCLNKYPLHGYSNAQTIRKNISRSVPNRILYFGYKDFHELIQANNVNVKKGDMIVTRHKKIVKYFVPEVAKVGNFMLTVDEDKLYADLIKKKANYLYIDKRPNFLFSSVMGVINKHKSYFVLVSENKNAAIYKTQF